MKKKTLSTGKKFLVILLFSISIIFLGILLSFFIKFLYIGITTQDRDIFDESIISLVFSFILGLVSSTTLIILLCDYDKNKKEKNRKWYVDKFLFGLTPVWITVATVFFSFYQEDSEGVYLLFSIIIYIIIGISTTPNVVLYALNDMKNWKTIFYNKGNFSRNKYVNGFYMMRAPVSLFCCSIYSFIFNNCFILIFL